MVDNNGIPTETAEMDGQTSCRPEQNFYPLGHELGDQNSSADLWPKIWFKD